MAFTELSTLSDISLDRFEFAYTNSELIWDKRWFLSQYVPHNRCPLIFEKKEKKSLYTFSWEEFYFSAVWYGTWPWSPPPGSMPDICWCPQLLRRKSHIFFLFLREINRDKMGVVAEIFASRGFIPWSFSHILVRIRFDYVQSVSLSIVPFLWGLQYPAAHP